MNLNMHIYVRRKNKIYKWCIYAKKKQDIPVKRKRSAKPNQWGILPREQNTDTYLENMRGVKLKVLVNGKPFLSAPSRDNVRGQAHVHFPTLVPHQLHSSVQIAPLQGGIELAVLNLPCSEVVFCCITRLKYVFITNDSYIKHDMTSYEIIRQCNT
jgi:hypothetical protein